MNALLKGTHLLKRPVRALVWGGALVLLLVPAVAMQFTSEVDWTGSDFLVMGAMLAAACGAFELATRRARNNACVLAAGLALGAAFLTVWINLAVGIVGAQGNPVNDLFFGVVAFALAASLVARFQPRPMVIAMAATGVVQLCVGLYAANGQSPEAWVFTVAMCAAWWASSALYRYGSVAAPNSR